MPKKCVNRVFLMGNLVRDAETKVLPGGSAVTRFTVATSRSYKQGEEWKEESTFTNCSGFRLDKVSNYLTRGKQVYVEGRIQTRSWEKEGVKQYATEVSVEDLILCGSSEGRPAPASYGKSGEHPLSENRIGITDDDVPF
jgi:single-strand DNA-binding protein